MRKIWVVFLVLLVALAACRPTATPTPAPVAATPTPAPTPQPTPTPTPTPEILRIAEVDFAVEALEPIRATMRQAFLIRPIYDVLIGIDDEGQLNANTGLAYKWEMSPDNKKFTVWVRKGVKFHNGDELTPEDVKFSMERVLATWSISAFKTPIAKALDRMEIVAPDQLIYHLKEPTLTFWIYLSPLLGTEGFVVPKKYIEQVGEDAFARNPIGSGPYRFVKHVPGAYVEYEAVPNHWRVGTPKFKKLRIEKVTEEGTRVAKLKTGELEAALVSVARIEELEKAGFRIMAHEAANQVGLHFLRTETAGNPLADKRVREALALAINREEVVKFIFKGKGKPPGNYPFGPWTGGYLDLPPYPYDPQQAKKLLAEAGFEKGFTIYIHAPSVYPEHMDVAQAVAGYFKAIGLNPAVLSMDYGLFRPMWRRDKPLMGEPGVLLYRYGQRWPMLSEQQLFHSSAGAKTWGETWDATSDALYTELVASPNMDIWLERTKKVQQYHYDNFFNAGIAELDDVYAVDPKVITKWNMGKLPYDPNIEYLFRSK